MTPQIMPQDLDAAPEAWTRVRGALLGQLGQDAFQNWIDPLVFVGCRPWRRAPDGADELHRHLGVAQLRRHHPPAPLQERRRGQPPRVRRRAAGRRRAPARGAGPRRRRRPAAGGDPPDVDLPASPLDGRCTFDNFVVGKPNELAHAAARGVAEGVAEGGPVTFNPLFLYGGVGLGKTHLMHAIAWEVRQTNPEARVLYLSAEQFMYRFVSALRFKDMHGFKEMFRSVDMLMVDDVQFISGKDSTQEEFFHTFNALIEQQKQIVISADRAPGEIDGLEERIRSRLQWGLVVDLHPTDYELRLGILQAKAEAQLERNPGVVIGAGVMEFLAHRISSNVRVLEGALNRLFAYASLVGRDHRPRHDPGVPRRHPARLRAQGHDRRDPAQGRRPLQPPHVRPAVGAARAAGGAAAAGGDVPRQDADLASLARHRPPLRRPRPHHGDPRRAQDRGAAATDSQIAEDVELLRRMLEA